jgi:hypothetical protein
MLNAVYSDDVVYNVECHSTIGDIVPFHNVWYLIVGYHTGRRLHLGG